jgi:hypothetical protein
MALQVAAMHQSIALSERIQVEAHHTMSSPSGILFCSTRLGFHLFFIHSLFDGGHFKDGY